MPALFQHPVTILVGLGFPRRIGNAGAACAFLDEYPQALRDLAYEATLDACRVALADPARANEANDLFAAFARRRGILVEDRFHQAAAGAREQLLGI
jgi:hypothetical protein